MRRRQGTLEIRSRRGGRPSQVLIERRPFAERVARIAAVLSLLHGSSLLSPLATLFADDSSETIRVSHPSTPHRSSKAVLRSSHSVAVEKYEASVGRFCIR